MAEPSHTCTCHMTKLKHTHEDMSDKGEMPGDNKCPLTRPDLDAPSSTAVGSRSVRDFTGALSAIPTVLVEKLESSTLRAEKREGPRVVAVEKRSGEFFRDWSPQKGAPPDNRVW